MDQPLFESKGNTLARFSTETFLGLADDFAAELAVETHRPVIIRQSPDYGRTIAVVGKILKGHLEQSFAEAEALKLRSKVKFENLSGIRHGQNRDHRKTGHR